MTELQANLQSVRERIAAAARRAGRDPAAVTLVAVSKYQPPEVIRAAYDLGQRHFGENRVDEAQAKVAHLPADITWHMIGHVQSRQAKRVVPLFQVVHSTDSDRLAERLDRLCAEEGRRLPVLIEINVSGEATKNGLPADRWATDAVQRKELWALAAKIAALPHLEVQGLMTMAPQVADPEDVRPVFVQLRQLRDALAAELGGAWPHLSMGMTDDFEVAVEEGATLVRVGRAIFASDLGAWCEIRIPAASEA